MKRPYLKTEQLRKPVFSFGFRFIGYPFYAVSCINRIGLKVFLKRPVAMINVLNALRPFVIASFVNILRSVGGCREGEGVYIIISGLKC